MKFGFGLGVSDIVDTQRYLAMTRSCAKETRSSAKSGLIIFVKQLVSNSIFKNSQFKKLLPLFSRKGRFKLRKALKDGRVIPYKPLKY